jgi:hypothetical protein
LRYGTKGLLRVHKRMRSGCVDQTRHFLLAQHGWQSTLVLRVRQEIAELMALERFSPGVFKAAYTFESGTRNQALIVARSLTSDHARTCAISTLFCWQY